MMNMTIKYFWKNMVLLRAVLPELNMHNYEPAHVLNNNLYKQYLY